MTTAPVRVAAIVLAAGRSTRMGPQNKLLAHLDGKPMVRVVVETALASKARPILVVTGHMAAEVSAALEGGWSPQMEQGVGRSGGVPPAPRSSPQGGGESRRDADVTLVPNPDYATGLASSLKAGIRAVPDGCNGALILLGDMPGITAEHVDRLVDAFAEAPDTIVVPVHQGRQGNPVLWPHRYFSQLLQLEGDAGAKRLISAHAGQVREVELATDEIFADIDTPEEFARIRTE
jgi:molybdenum cofactor cytidylyltransferase